MVRPGIAMLACAAFALLAGLLSVAMLERQRAGLVMERYLLAGSPATVWRSEERETGPLVVVAHGYAGSRQMMQPVSIALARAGFVVAAFDFLGHGRNSAAMTGDVTALDGATARLVDQTVAVARAARDLPGVTMPVALVGHSMATDVVIRAAGRLEDVAAVVAISMYSDAVTAEAPERLLIVSGAREGRLREVALDRLRQVDPTAGEGRTVGQGNVLRRVAVAPVVGHVGVLYSGTTLAEVRDWIAAATAQPATGGLPRIGPWLVLLLSSIVALAWPLAGLLGRRVARPRVPRRTALVAVAAPVLPALAVTWLLPADLFGSVAFGSLAAFFLVWGGVQALVLWRAGVRPARFDGRGFALLLLWGLCLFAVALDRYGAAFVPTGPRLPLMALLLCGTVPFCLADGMVTRGTGWLAWLGARLLPLVTLLGAMLLTPRLGIAFTVLPVLVLFWCVYGLAARWISARVGATAPGLALGIVLAWAIAASTPVLAG